MSIGNYLQIIGRGKDGARALSREHATDMFGQILDGTISDVELGAFCLAMRIKGETPQEMHGFLDATHQRIHKIQPLADTPNQPLIVLPSYNGARRLPVLTPLLALLLARAGETVVIHGAGTESRRVFTAEVLSALDIHASTPEQVRKKGQVYFVPTQSLSPGLQRLLDVRRLIQLRNPAHSLVKLMNPCAGPSVLVTSYTHPEYAQSMGEVITLTHTTALLSRGTEGEAVADPRRTPAMRSFVHGALYETHEAPTGALTDLPELPGTCEAAPTAQYIQSVLDGTTPVPAPIALQVQRILQLVTQSKVSTHG
jgi:anthranilate phosphoribosyltransferase